MIKRINRSTLILICTLLLGVLAVGITQYPESGDVVVVNDNTSPEFQNNIYDKLKTKVASLKSGTFNPNSFDVVEGSVQGYLSEELITIPAASALKAEMNRVFADRVYAQCEMFLRNGTGNSAQVLQWLNLLQSKVGTNSRINNYRSQINWYQYYSIALPNKVNAFVQSGIGNYEDAKYQGLKNEVQNMPGFSPDYKNKSKFINITSSLMNRLYQFNYDYNN